MNFCLLIEIINHSLHKNSHFLIVIFQIDKRFYYFIQDNEGNLRGFL